MFSKYSIDSYWYCLPEIFAFPLQSSLSGKNSWKNLFHSTEWFTHSMQAKKKTFHAIETIFYVFCCWQFKSSPVLCASCKPYMHFNCSMTVTFRWTEFIYIFVCCFLVIYPKSLFLFVDVELFFVFPEIWPFQRMFRFNQIDI